MKAVILMRDYVTEQFRGFALPLLVQVANIVEIFQQGS